MSTSNREFNQQIPLYNSLPEQWEEAHKALVDKLQLMGNAINNRETVWVVEEETLTGKLFIEGASGEFRNIFRKAINIGTLPNNTTLSVAHGITIDANFTLLQVYGGGSDPVGLNSIPLPFVSSAGAAIEVNIDANNINIVTTGNYSAYTSSYVIVEYIREV